MHGSLGSRLLPYEMELMLAVRDTLEGMVAQGSGGGAASAKALKVCHLQIVWHRFVTLFGIPGLQEGFAKPVAMTPRAPPVEAFAAVAESSVCPSRMVRSCARVPIYGCLCR